MIITIIDAILLIITFIEAKLHITIGKIIKYRWLGTKLTNNLGPFESSRMANLARNKVK